MVLVFKYLVLSAWFYNSNVKKSSPSFYLVLISISLRVQLVLAFFTRLRIVEKRDLMINREKLLAREPQHNVMLRRLKRLVLAFGFNNNNVVYQLNYHIRATFRLQISEEYWLHGFKPNKIQPLCFGKHAFVGPTHPFDTWQPLH